MNASVFKALIWISNSSLFNRLLRAFAKGKFSRRLIPLYIRTYHISLEDVQKPLEAFTSLNDFFIRELRPDARPISADENTVVSPVDCKLELSQTITEVAEFKIKGHTMSLAELLGSETDAKRFTNGHIFVLYLSPADYHRMHAPFDGESLKTYTLGKNSWPVNDLGLRIGPRPLCTNYRVIHKLDNGSAAIFVGATNVNSIVCYDYPFWKKGAELGYFQFGSTVVLLFQEGQIRPLLSQGQPLRMGEALAQFQ